MIARRTLIAGSLGGLLWPVTSQRLWAEEVPENVTIAVSSTSFVLAGAKIGEQAGLFARNGINLRIVVMESGNAAMSALISGSVPFAVTGPPDALMARARGQDIMIAVNLYAGFAGSVVLATAVAQKLGVPPTAPIKDRFRALDGLVLAVPSATSVLLAPIRKAVEDAGAKVRFTYMAQGTMPAALETNAIQGMVASYPFAGTPVLRGAGVLWIDGPGGELPPDVAPASSSSVQTTGVYLKANRNTVRKLQQAIVAIAEFIDKDQEHAKQALAASYPDLSAQEIGLAFKQQWRNWTKPFLNESDIRQELKLLISSTKAPGLQQLDPTSALVGPL
jgi:ABC-type nitrate/sulfonate/bicarbonate transport system substrate-binding protein